MDTDKHGFKLKINFMDRVEEGDFKFEISYFKTDCGKGRGIMIIP
jgi:hypothetical protein